MFFVLNLLDFSILVDEWHNASLTFFGLLEDSILETPGTTISGKVLVSLFHMNHMYLFFIPIYNTIYSRYHLIIEIICTVLKLMKITIIHYMLIVQQYMNQLCKNICKNLNN